MTRPDRPGAHPAARLDDTVHQRVRLGILSVLDEAGEAEFTYLRQVLELSDGNLNRHLAVLGEAGFVRTRRVASSRRARTWVHITAAGRRALHDELTELRRIVDGYGRRP